MFLVDEFITRLWNYLLVTHSSAHTVVGHIALRVSLQLAGDVMGGVESQFYRNLHR
jgi:hypothetical protein